MKGVFLMKKILKNYKSTIILLGAIIIGTIIGIIFGEKAGILSPFGDLFINLLLRHFFGIYLRKKLQKAIFYSKIYIIRLSS